jgi:hypothetical protein
MSYGEFWSQSNVRPPVTASKLVMVAFEARMVDASTDSGLIKNDVTSITQLQT